MAFCLTPVFSINHKNIIMMLFLIMRFEPAYLGHYMLQGNYNVLTTAHAFVMIFF